MLYFQVTEKYSTTMCWHTPTCQNIFPTCQNNFPNCQNNFPTCQNNFPTAKIIFPPAKLIFSPAKIIFPTKEEGSLKQLRKNVTHTHRTFLLYILYITLMITLCCRAYQDRVRVHSWGILQIYDCSQVFCFIFDAKDSFLSVTKTIFQISLSGDTWSKFLLDTH